MAAPSRERALLVFGQTADARIEIESWNTHATRFFSTAIGLTTDKRYPAGYAAPRTDEAAFVVAPPGEPPAIRSVAARPSDADDQALAEAADARRGPSGLALLARRCGMVWLVTRDEPSDRVALRLAAILASILLGPILDAAAGDLFGVKTARARLEDPTAHTIRS
jgi:hypothetical protein